FERSGSRPRIRRRPAYAVDGEQLFRDLLDGANGCRPARDQMIGAAVVVRLIDDGDDGPGHPVYQDEVAWLVAGEGKSQRQNTSPPATRVRRGGAGRRGGRGGGGRGQAGAQLQETIQPVITACEAGATVADDYRWAVDGRPHVPAGADAPLRFKFALFVV